MRFGANYVPSENWFYSWNCFSEDSVERDLLSLKGIGVDHIIWNIFQWDKAVVSPVALENPEKFVKVCEKTDMDFFLSVFSGFDNEKYIIKFHSFTQGRQNRRICGGRAIDASGIFSAHLKMPAGNKPFYGLIMPPALCRRL